MSDEQATQVDSKVGSKLSDSDKIVDLLRRLQIAETTLCAGLDTRPDSLPAEHELSVPELLSEARAALEGAYPAAATRLVPQENQQESDSFYRAVLDSLSQQVAILDQSGNIIATNQAWQRFIQENEHPVAAQAKIGANYPACWASVPDPVVGEVLDVQDIVTGIRDVLNGSLPDYTCVYACNSGITPLAENRWFRLRVMRMISPWQAIIVTQRDITPYVLAREAAHKSELRLRTILDGAAIGITVVGKDGHVVEANPAFQRMLGYSSDELRQIPFSEITYPDDLAQDLELAGRLVLGEIEHYQIEKRFIRKDKQVIWANLTASAIRDPEAPSLMGIGMIEDITQRKLAQLALQRHDMVLNVLAGISEQFLRDPDLDSVLPDTLAQLGQAAEVSRVQIYRAQVAPDGSGHGNLTYEWVADGITPMIDNAARQNFALSKFNLWKGIFTAQGAVYGLTRNLPAQIRQNLEIGQTLAFAIVPILCGGEVWGFLAFADCKTERQWLPAEIESLRQTASLLGGVLKRQRAEQALSMADKRFATVVRASPVPISILSLTTAEFVDVNDAYLSMYGVSREEVIGKTPLDLNLWVDRAQLEIFLDEQRRGVQGTLVEYGFRRMNGETGIGLISTEHIEIGDERYIIGFIVDITDRKYAVDKLRESEERYRLIVDNALDGIYILDAQTTINYVNQRLLDMLGYSLDEMLGKSALALMGNQRGDATQDSFRQYPARRYELAIPRRDGTLVSTLVSSTPLRDASGKFVGRLGIIEDITERKQAEGELRRLNAELEQRVEQRTAELRYQQTQLGALLEGMGEGMFYAEGHYIRYANRALADLTGYASRELVGQPGTIFMGDKNSGYLDNLIAAVGSASVQTVRSEVRLRRKDGTEFDAALTVTPVAEVGSPVSGVVAIVRDITDEKRTDAQKAAFVANASHELRTPLTTLKTRIYLLKRQPERFMDHLAVLDNVTDWMATLIEDLLDLSRYDRGVIALERETVILQDIVRKAVELQEPEAQRKDIVLHAEMPSTPVYVNADSARLMQVVVNLVVNAINYTLRGGNVDVELHVEPGCVTVQVRDTGIGIDPEHLGRVFEPFFRINETAARGTGLGLSIAKTIVEMHGGSLLVNSSAGRGSTFTVKLATADQQ